MAAEAGVFLDGEGAEKKSNKLVIILVTILIVLIWLAIFVLLVKLDVGGFGSKVLYPVLKDVPVINRYFLMHRTSRLELTVSILIQRFLRL